MQGVVALRVMAPVSGDTLAPGSRAAARRHRPDRRERVGSTGA
jgi:hypothetical protein